MKTGFEGLRRVMVEGYKPSVARLYDVADSASHFNWADGKNVLLFMAEGPAAITRATADGIDALVKELPGITPVDPVLIEKWFAHLNWGRKKLPKNVKKSLPQTTLESLQKFPDAGMSSMIFMKLLWIVYQRGSGSQQ